MTQRRVDFIDARVEDLAGLFPDLPPDSARYLLDDGEENHLGSEG